MGNHENDPVSGPPWLDAWTGLEPDPTAMAQVADLMVAQMAAKAPLRDRSGEETAFRRVLAVWAVVLLAGYLVRPSLLDWYATHPYWVILGVSGGIACLLVPVISALLHLVPAQGLTHLD